jgi:phosphoribosylformylglycinamidine (FGAM) synthase-like enzyme
LEVGHLGQSLWASEILGLRGAEAGLPPPVDLSKERATGELVRELIARGLVTAVHDVSDGGLLIATCEMAFASGVGFTWEFKSHDPVPASLFGEDQCRYVVAVPDLKTGLDVLQLARDAGVLGDFFAEAGGNAVIVTVSGGVEWANVSLTDLRAAHEGFFPKLMGADAALA